MTWGAQFLEKVVTTPMNVDKNKVLTDLSRTD